MSDLYVYHYGMEKCEPKHPYGPALRDHFLIHYILKGKGTFRVNGSTYTLKENQGFLIPPNIITYYEADELEPWTYTWVGFRGIKAEFLLKNAGLTMDNPIFTYEGPALSAYFEAFRASENYKFSYDLRLQGYLSILLSELIEQNKGNTYENEKVSQKEMYIKKTIQFIETNYSRTISIDSLAKYLGLNKNYFSTLFKEEMGQSPQEYLIKYRINKACQLLENKDLSISQVSRSVGYPDPLAFSKIFKQFKGVSPKNWLT
jgi:AraC-like DNA-binding protein